MRTCTPDSPLQPVPSHPETPSFSQGQNSLLATSDLAQVGQQEDGDRTRMSCSHEDGSGKRGTECVVWCERGWDTPMTLVHLPQREGRAPAGRDRGPQRSISWSRLLHASIFLGEKSTDSASPRTAPRLWTEESATTCRNQALGPIPQVLGPRLPCEQLQTAAF